MRSPNKDDWRKMVRLVDYLKGTRDMHLRLKMEEGLSVATWFIDASFACHDDFRSQTGGILKFAEDSGGFISISTRQKLNTRSSTEAEIVAVDDCVGKVLWTSRFLKVQGFAMKATIIKQDNKSAMLLEVKGRASAGKRMRHMDVRFFFVNDLVSKGMVSIEHCGTQEMLADVFTKPLQGQLFKKFRSSVLGLQ